ncbi:MAG: ABC transporter ATP-binding protein [Candidatus Micrarchaeaceae archaeon]
MAKSKNICVEYTMMDIEISGIVKRFGNVTALNGVSLKAGKGINMILGPNGAGKSTLLRCIDGLYRPDAGSISVMGHNPYYDDIIRKKMSLLSDNYGLYDYLSVMDNLKFFGRLYGLKDKNISAQATSLIKEFDASEYLDRKVYTLSRGTKQKVAICRAMLGNPEIMLLDEPTAFLDAASAEELRNVLRGMAKVTTILYVTQKIDEIERMQGRITVLRKGRIVGSTSLENIYSNVFRGLIVKIKFAKPVSSKMLKGIRGIRANSSDAQSISIKIKSYKEINSALKELISNGATVISVSYEEPTVEDFMNGGRIV